MRTRLPSRSIQTVRLSRFRSLKKIVAADVPQLHAGENVFRLTFVP